MMMMTMMAQVASGHHHQQCRGVVSLAMARGREQTGCRFPADNVAVEKGGDGGPLDGHVGCDELELS